MMRFHVTAALVAAALVAPACSSETPPPPAVPEAPAAAPTVKTPTVGAVEPAPAPVEPAEKHAEPAAEPAGQPAEPAAEPTEPAEPAAEPAAAPTEPAEPPAKPAEPAGEPAEPPSEPTEPEPAAPADGQPSDAPKMHDLTLSAAAMTNQIVDRMPDEKRAEWVIGADPEVLLWMEFDNRVGDVELETVWKKDGQERWRFPFNVGRSKNWRTWVKKRIGKRDAGSWTVEVLDAGGFVYRTEAFTIKEGTD